MKETKSGASILPTITSRTPPLLLVGCMLTPGNICILRAGEGGAVKDENISESEDPWDHELVADDG